MDVGQSAEIFLSVGIAVAATLLIVVWWLGRAPRR